MGEEQSNRILTFKFNYNVLFLTTEVLQLGTCLKRKLNTVI